MATNRIVSHSVMFLSNLNDQECDVLDQLQWLKKPAKCFSVFCKWLCRQVGKLPKMVKICFNILLAFVYIIHFKLRNYLQKQLKYGLFKLRSLFGRFFDSSFTGYICSISLFLEGQKFWKNSHDLYILRFRLCGCNILYFIMNNTIKAISSSVQRMVLLCYILDSPITNLLLLLVYLGLKYIIMRYVYVIIQKNNREA